MFTPENSYYSICYNILISWEHLLIVIQVTTDLHLTLCSINGENPENGNKMTKSDNLGIIFNFYP